MGADLKKGNTRNSLPIRSAHEQILSVLCLFYSEDNLNLVYTFPDYNNWPHGIRLVELIIFITKD